MGTTRVTVTLRIPGSPAVAYRADFVADTGATDCVVPASVLRRAGIAPVETMTYELASLRSRFGARRRRRTPSRRAPRA